MKAFALSRWPRCQAGALFLVVVVGMVALTEGRLRCFAAQSEPPLPTPESSKPMDDWNALKAHWQTEPVSRLREAAERGDKGAQFYLGRSYALGAGVPQDQNAARDWYRKAAEQGSALAQYSLGLSAENDGISGNTVIGNYPVAAEWFEKAAAQGHLKAMVHLGDLYYFGKLKRDNVEAVKWYRRAAEAGDPDGAGRLGEVYLNNRGDVAQDHAQALRWLRFAAQKDNAEAQFELSRLLVEGEGVPHDAAEAERWLRQAAANGYLRAIQELAGRKEGSRNLDGLGRDELEDRVRGPGGSAARLTLGIDYEEGRGGPVNLYRAAGLYWMILIELQGPEKDRPEARRRLLALYTAGRLKLERPRNPAELESANGRPLYYANFAPWSPDRISTFLYQGAQATVSPEQQWQIAEAFYHGEVVPEDWPKAVDCYWRAAQGGSLEAVNRLGQMWATGVDGEPDLKEAARWYRRAATNGLAAAQLNLARALRQGAGVDRNLPEAWCWFRLAADRGSTEAGLELKSLESQMTPAEGENARARLEAYRAVPVQPRNGTNPK